MKTVGIINKQRKTYYFLNYNVIFNVTMNNFKRLNTKLSDTYFFVFAKVTVPMFVLLNKFYCLNCYSN